MGTLDTIDAFRAAMHEAGTPSPDVIDADGLLHRYHVDGDKRGTLNGWYCLHLDGRAAGIFGNWKTGLRSLGLVVRAALLDAGGLDAGTNLGQGGGRTLNGRAEIGEFL